MCVCVRVNSENDFFDGPTGEIWSRLETRKRQQKTTKFNGITKRYTTCGLLDNIITHYVLNSFAQCLSTIKIGAPLLIHYLIFSVFICYFRFGTEIECRAAEN